jgi:hypothetical protein
MNLPINRALRGSSKCLAVSLAASLIAGLGVGAFAQTPEQVIAFLDKDADGKVNLNEYLLFQQPRLAEFDENGDGELSRKEFKNSLQGDGKKNADRSFDAFNANGGRGLIQKEFLGYHAFVFNNFVDANKDGFMSSEEWAKLMGR